MAEKPLIDISPENWKIVRSILQRYIPEREVWAFGSRAKWTAKEFSDLDVAVIADEPMSISLTAGLDEAFQESALPFKVDIVDWATITPSFRQVIQFAKVQVQEGKKVANWTTKLVSEIADLNPTRSLKKGAVSPFIEMAALPVNSRDIPVQDVSTRDFSGSGSRFMNGDVLLARITPCLENGKTALVNVLDPSIVGHGSTEFIVLSAKEITDQRFTYYLARHPDFREYAIQHMEGTSGRQRVSSASVGSYRFLCPPSPQRKEIGDILGALDDKILLLRETNSTLEAIAQALFKSWFVDFDPVRAKAEGREPEGVPPEIAELYPTEFEDSKLGEIPKGWEISHLGKVSTNIRAGVKPQNLNRDTPYIGLEHMPRQSISLDAWGHAEGLESGKFYFRTGQILFGKLRPYFHKVGIAPVDGVCSTDILVIEEKNVEWRAFCICHYSSDALIEHATMLSNGAKMPRSSWQDISGFKVVLPPLEIASAFNTILSPLLKRIVANVHHMSSLGKVRDELLAPLMSGKLEMSGAGA